MIQKRRMKWSFVATMDKKKNDQKQAEKQKKGYNKNTLEREEKQPDGMTVNPFSSI